MGGRPDWDPYPSRTLEYRRAYNQAYRSGERWRAKVDVSVRILEKLDRDPGELIVPELGPCWVWRGARNAGGYGVVRDNHRRLILVHRATLVLALGRPLGEGMVARHRCDNPPCARPSHLLEGTQQDNVDDMHERGRWAIQAPKGGEAVA